MYRVETRHWWYRGMAAITCRILDRWYRPGGGLRILDAGCGTGAAMTTYLAEYGTVTGFDVSDPALRFCMKRNARRIARASVEHIPFASNRFDLVTSFDVLYERAVRDDAAALAEIARVIAPGGRLLLRLPAYDWLRGQHDRAIHTARRYHARQLTGLLRRGGFVVEWVSYANTFLFPLALLKRLAERIRPPRRDRSDLTLEVGPLDRLLGLILRLEASLAASTGLPFGLSLVAVGRKPEK